MKQKKEKYILSSRHHFFTGNIFIIAAVSIFFILLFTVLFILKQNNFFLPSLSSIYKDWNKGDYLSCYEKTSRILEHRPLDGAVLAMHGFSAYYIYTGQINVTDEQNYLNTAVTSLRKAWYRVVEEEKPEIAYVLGKTYYQKGFYYADLALKYLYYARNSGADYPDIPEFCGLSLVLLEEYEDAVEFFTEALANKPSDLLLYTLADTYAKIPDYMKAKQYFTETLRITQDDLLKLKCHNAMGGIFLSEKLYPEAEAEFKSIIEKDPDSADAYFGLGLIQESQGDIVKARAQWRKALKLNPSHAGAREKLSS